MASALYDKFRENCLLAGTTHVSFSTGSIRVLVMSTKYTFSASDQFVSQIIGGASTKLIKRSTSSLASKTITSGVANAANFTVASVLANTPYSGAVCKSIVLFNDTPATDATKPLICYIDVATGLPFTPVGTNVTIAWSTGANKIFKL